jgi:hypothetical protein
MPVHPGTRVIDFPLIYIIKSFQFTPIPIMPVHPGTHVIDFPLIYIIKSFQFTPIPIMPVYPGMHPRRKSRATCIVII